MTDSEKAARMDGQLAAIRGKPPTKNPHPLGTTQSRAWARGYREITDA